MQDACQTVQKYIGLLSCVQDVEVKADLLWAEEAIKGATLFMDVSFSFVVFITFPFDGFS